VYWLKNPLVVLTIAALVSLAIGLTIAPAGFVVAGGLVAVMLIGVAWPWIGMWGVSATLRFTRRRCREGELVAGILTVTNRMPWPAWGLVLERGFAGSDDKFGERAAGMALALARVPGFSQCDYRFDFEPPCRGVYPQATPQLTTAFPFGLWKRGRDVPVQEPLLVWPRMIPLEALPLAQGRSWSLGAPSDRRAGQQAEVIGTRAYRPGDLARHVHWAQSARQGRLIVCERQASLTAAVRVTLDLRSSVHVGDGADASREWAFRTAASICHSLLSHCARLAVDLGGELLTVEPGPQGITRLGDALARWQPPATESRPRGSQRVEGDLEIVVTTDRGLSAGITSDAANRQLIVLGTLPQAFANGELPRAGVMLIDLCDSEPAEDRPDQPDAIASRLRHAWERTSRHAWQIAR
jgi:uncharacterized protein (DUF58 family)